MEDPIKFFSKLSPESWNAQVTEKWKVEDVFSHLLGWEREVALTLPESQKSGE
jgi:hypothetical protein